LQQVCPWPHWGDFRPPHPLARPSLAIPDPTYELHPL